MDPSNEKTAPEKSPLPTIHTVNNGVSTNMEDIKRESSDIISSYFEQQSKRGTAQPNFMLKSEPENNPVQDLKKRPKLQLKYNVQPITDQDKINQLYSKNSGSSGYFTRVASKPISKGETMLVPYCTPTMYYVCYKCGMAGQDGRKIDDHVKNDPHTDNKKLRNYIKLEKNQSKKEPRLGWYKNKRYLVIEACRYGFACACGITSESTRSLQIHFKECTYTDNILPTVSSGSCVDLDGIVPLRSVNGKECDVKIDTYLCGFNRSVNDLMFCYNIPSKELLIGQCQNRNQERRYKIINYCRKIDIILNKNWEEILKLVDLKKICC
jgi:hypothetical protein